MPLNTLPFPTSNDVPYYDNKDANNFLTMPVEQYIRNGSNLFVPVSATNPQPTFDATVKAALDSILAKILAAPATEAKQTALNALIGEVQATPTANTLLARVKNLETKIDAIIAGTSTAAVTVSGSKHALPAVVDASQVLNVTAGGNTLITITPPAGELWKLLNLYISIAAPSGASAGGAHNIVLSNVNASGPSIISGSNDYNAAVTLSRGYFSTIKTPNPTLPADQQRILHRQRFSNTSPLAIAYYNYTDATQTGTIAIKYIKEVDYIVA